MKAGSNLTWACLITLLGALIAVSAATPSIAAEEPSAVPTAAERQAVKALNDAGGTITIDGDFDVVSVSISSRRPATQRLTDEMLIHLKALTQLTSLTLSSDAVTDAGLEHLKGLKNLRTVSIESSQVTDDGLESLRQALPECRVTRRRTGFSSSPDRGSFTRPSIWDSLLMARTSLLRRLFQSEVQQELNLTAEQNERLRALREEMRNNEEYEELSKRYQRATADQARLELHNRMSAIRTRIVEEADSKAQELLTAAQLQRARQLILQADGAKSLLGSDVATKLELSTEQQEKLKSIEQEASEQAISVRGSRLTSSSRRRRLSGFTREKSKQMLAVLTGEQFETWIAMLGEPAAQSSDLIRSARVFRQASVPPLPPAFSQLAQFLDRNGDGQLSENELARVRSFQERVERSGIEPQFPIPFEQFIDAYRRPANDE